MNKIILTLILGVLSSFTQAQTINNYDQQWFQYYGQAKLSDRSKIGTDLGYRRKNLFHDPAQWIGRLSYWYKTGESTSAGAGFAMSCSYSGELNTVLEYRPYQEFVWQTGSTCHSLQLRYRLEERFFTDRVHSEPVDYRFSLRNRFAISYSRLLFKPVSSEQHWSVWGVASMEFFVNIKLNEANSWFDQGRIVTGPELKLNERLCMQLLYNFQLSPVAGSPDFKATHIAWFTIRQRLDFSKPEATE